MNKINNFFKKVWELEKVVIRKSVDNIAKSKLGDSIAKALKLGKYRVINCGLYDMPLVVEAEEKQLLTI